MRRNEGKTVIQFALSRHGGQTQGAGAIIQKENTETEEKKGEILSFLIILKQADTVEHHGGSKNGNKDENSQRKQYITSSRH